MPRGLVLALALSLSACSSTADDGLFSDAPEAEAGAGGRAAAGSSGAGGGPAGSAGAVSKAAGGSPGAAGSSGASSAGRAQQGGSAGQGEAGEGGGPDGPTSGGGAGSGGSAGARAGSGGAQAGSAGAGGTSGAPVVAEGGEGGAAEDDWLTRPVPGCEGFTDVRVPAGKCVYIRGRWVGGTADCRSTTLVNTCSVVEGPRDTFRISNHVASPNVATIEFLELENGQCPESCD